MAGKGEGADVLSFVPLIRFFVFAFMLATMCVVPAAVAEEKVVKLAGTDWPPYMNSKADNQGIIIEISRRAFSRAGYKLEVSFSAWQRSLLSAYTLARFDGIAAIYKTEDREKRCSYTRPLFSSPIGFVERKDSPAKWEKLEDLGHLHIGTVMGYHNTKEFDRLAEEGTLHISAVYEDKLNLKRLIFGRIDLAVMDPFVMQYLLKTNPELSPYSQILAMNAKILTKKKLYLCFVKNERSEELVQAFNAAFDEEEVEQIIWETLGITALYPKLR